MNTEDLITYLEDVIPRSLSSDSDTKADWRREIVQRLREHKKYLHPDETWDRHFKYLAHLEKLMQTAIEITVENERMLKHLVAKSGNE